MFFVSDEKTVRHGFTHTRNGIRARCDASLIHARRWRNAIGCALVTPHVLQAQQMSETELGVWESEIATNPRTLCYFCHVERLRTYIQTRD